jgi:predicted acyl esterase
VIVERDLMAPTRDGVSLATEIYRPDGAGPFPVLLERTPYDKAAPSRSERTAAVDAPRSREEVAAYFVEHGYAVAEIVGPVTLRLWIASDAPDNDFTAKLLDAYPPSTDYPHGFAMNLTEGLLRVRYRDSWERSADNAGRGLSNRDHAVSDRQSVLPRPPAAPRHFEQQFPAFRREPKFGRAGRIPAAPAHRT